MAFLDLTGLTRYTTKMKAWVSSLIKNNSTTTDSGYALDASQAPLLKVLKKSYGEISGMGTITDSDVTADMVVVASQLGTPSAQKSNWTVTAKAGSFTLAGTIDGTTTLTIYWARSRGTGNTTSLIPYGDNAMSTQDALIAKRERVTSLGDFASLSDLASLLNTAKSNMTTGHIQEFSVHATASFGPFVSGRYYQSTMYNVTSSSARAMMYSNGSGYPISGRSSSGEWTFDELAPISQVGEFSDAGMYTIPASGSITLEISNSTTIFLCISHNSNGTAFLGMWLVSIGTGSYSIVNILPSSVISIASSGNKQMTVSNSNANYAGRLSMYRVYGNATVEAVA